MSPAPALSLSLDGRTAVVTGASRGIGYAIARRFAEAGAVVVMTDVSPEVEAVAGRLLDAGHAVFPRVMDVRDESRHEAIADEVVLAHGALDVWVNNAGVFPVGEALAITADEWRDVMAVNLDGAFFGARAAGRRMAARGSGVIINISSASAFRASGDGRAHYAASKAALNSVTRSLARELGGHGVRVVGIAPTATNTEGVAQRTGSPEADSLQAYAERLPLRRVAEPEDIAHVALFCASDLARCITGSTIPVDSGQLAV